MTPTFFRPVRVGPRLDNGREGDKRDNKCRNIFISTETYPLNHGLYIRHCFLPFPDFFMKKKAKRFNSEIPVFFHTRLSFAQSFLCPEHPQSSGPKFRIKAVIQVDALDSRDLESKV